MTLDDLQNHQEFKDSDLNTQLGWIDNFSGELFKSGNLQEASRAQEYRAQIELGSLAQDPTSQIMGGYMEALFPGDPRNTGVALGQENFDRIQKQYGERVRALEEPSNILQVEPGQYAYTRKNPFGTGTLLELDGQTKFLEDDQASPDAIKRIIAEEKLPTIAKSEVFDKVNAKLDPIYTSDGRTIGIDKADNLMSDPEFQALPFEDQRQLARKLRLNASNALEPVEAAKADQMISVMDREYDAKAAIGKYASKDAPWYDFFTNAVDRGNQRWMQNIDRKELEYRFSGLEKIRAGYSEEQNKTFDSIYEPLAEIASGDLSDLAGAKARVNELINNTALEGESPTKLLDYARTAQGVNRGEEAFILRGKALALIPQTEGMQKFSANQQKLKAEGAGGWAQAGAAARDMVTNPLDVVFNATLESMVAQPLSTVATAGLFAIPGGQGPGAAIATRLIQGTGAGLIAGAAESSYTYTQELDKVRFKADGTEIPMAEVLRDPILMRQVNDAAIARGVTMGTVEGVTGWVLPGSMNALDRAFASAGARKGSAMAFRGIEVAAQGVSEGTGEALATVAEGQEVNVGEVLLEMGAGAFGPDTLSMWQAPDAIKAKRGEQRAAVEAADLLAQAEAQATEAAALSPEAVVEEGRRNIYAEEIIPQVTIGPADAMGMADIEVWYDMPAMDQDAPLPATVEQGLENTVPVTGIPATEEVVDGEEAAVMENPITENITVSEPIENPAEFAEGQTVSSINPDGTVTSGTVSFSENGTLLIDGKKQSFRPGKYFTGVVKPKNNQSKVARGDVLFDGNTFYRYDDADPADYIVGQKNPDGTISFDPTERMDLTKGFVNDPRVKVYAKADFDTAVQDFNSRANPLPEDKFGQILSQTPEKGQEGASSDTEAQSAVLPQETTTEGAQKEPTQSEINEQAQTPVIENPVARNRVTMFKLRAHKSMDTLLQAGVNRFNEWMGKTKVYSQTPDSIDYSKNYKRQTLYRNQAPETFDETVKQLTKEDQEFRNYVEPQTWTEVPAYRELERFLKARVEKTQNSKSKSKSRRQRAILENAQVSSILQALFIQDKAIAAYAGAKFGLQVPNASLITVDDVANMRYGNVDEWKNTGAFPATIGGSYDPMARTIQLTGNASVVDVFHELYHDFFQNIAPLILTTGQYVRLQKFMEGRLAQTKFREYLKKNYRNWDNTPLTDKDMVFFDPSGNISVAAHEAFAQMMTRFHFDGRTVQWITEQDQAILKTITDFHAQVFQDLGRTPIATTTDDAHDLLQNFFITPASARREAFTPVNRQARINDEIVAEDLSLEELSAGIGGRAGDNVIPEEKTNRAPAQIIGDKLNDDFRPGENPEQGKPFASGGRTYVQEGEDIFELIETPAGTLKVPRKIEEGTQDQDEFPPDSAGMPAGTQTVSDENLPQTTAPEASKKPIKRVRIPLENDEVRIVTLDVDTGMAISNEVRKKGQRPKKKKEYTPPPPDPRLFSIQDSRESETEALYKQWGITFFDQAWISQVREGSILSALVKSGEREVIKGSGVPDAVQRRSLREAMPEGSTPTVYHDTSSKSAIQIIKQMNKGFSRLGQLYVTGRDELAIGQASGGVTLVMDSERLQGYAPKSLQNQVIQGAIGDNAEYIAESALKGAITGIVVKRESQLKALQKDSFISRAFDFEGAVKTESGWTVHRKDTVTPREVIRDEGPKLYSIQEDAHYNMGRMNKRLLGDGFILSRTLREIAREENAFEKAPTKEIQRRVEARMNSKVTILDALRDIYRLRKMSPDQRSKEFDPQNEYQGIGTASVIYYLLALQSRLNLLSLSQDYDYDLDMDRNTVEMLLKDVTRAVAIEQREAGRAVNINKQLLTYSPDTVIERLESDLVRNNAAFKRYVRKALEFGKRARAEHLTTDAELDALAKEQGFPAFLVPALRLYAKDDKASIRNFMEEAEKAWANQPNLPGRIRPESRANIRQLSMRAQAAKTPFVRDLYAQAAKLATQAERGPAMIEGMSGLLYNNVLFSPGVALVNMVSTAVRIPMDLIAYFSANYAMDMAERNTKPLTKNVAAIARGLAEGLKSFPEMATEFIAIAFSGQRGTSVEAFTKAEGIIASTQVMLYGRPGTKYQDRNNFWTGPRRLLTILLFDAGRRVATVFDAFYKVFMENSILGAELYSEAWDTYYAEGHKTDRGKFIEAFIDERLNVKPLSFYQAQAQEEMRLGGDVLLANSTSILPGRIERSILTNVMAFNMRREAREAAINPDSVDNAKRLAFAATFSNEPKGAAKVVVDQLTNLATVWGLSEKIGKLSPTWFLPGDTRLRFSAGGAINPTASLFSGNTARWAEEFLNWTGTGAILQMANNYSRNDGQIFVENNPDDYTKVEIGMSIFKGAVGMTTMIALMSLMGGDDDEEKSTHGLVGFRDRSIFGRNGKETFVPPYSYWWRTKDGNINYLTFKDHPQLVASLGVAASYNERRREDPDARWTMMFYRIPQAFLAGLGESGAYDALIDLAAFFKQAQTEGEPDEMKLAQGFEVNMAKNIRNYAVPLNRFQKETMAYSLLPGRGDEEKMPAKEFFPTLYANTLFEGWLTEDDAKKLDNIITPSGTLKTPKVLGRLGGFEVGPFELGNVIKPPSPALNWMVENGYELNRTDYQRPISSLFTKQAQKDKAEAAFAKMNNGMFYVQHASEIEKLASNTYWMWLESYSQDEKRKAELEAFVNSKTNQLEKQRNSPEHKTLRDLQQADINAIVTQARNAAALQISAKYYTTDTKVQGWAQNLADSKTMKGYKLQTPRVNKELEDAP